MKPLNKFNFLDFHIFQKGNKYRRYSKLTESIKNFQKVAKKVLEGKSSIIKI